VAVVLVRHPAEEVSITSGGEGALPGESTTPLDWGRAQGCLMSILKRALVAFDTGDRVAAQQRKGSLAQSEHIVGPRGDWRRPREGGAGSISCPGTRGSP